MLVGTLDGKDPTTKCHWEKIMLEIPTFSYFLSSGALDFVVLVLNYFPIQKELCSAFCSCKKSTCTCILYTCTLCIPLCIYENQLHNSSPLIWTLMILWLTQWNLNLFSFMLKIANLRFARSEIGQSPGKQMERRGAVQLPVFCLISSISRVFVCVSANFWVGNLDSGPTQVAFKLPENWRRWLSVWSGRGWP